MKVYNILLFLFLLCLKSLSAKSPSESFHMPRVVFVGEVGCNLPPPGSLNIDVIGSDWVDVSWPSVPGAVQYRLQAFDGASGNELGNAIFVPGTANAATVSTAGNNGSAYVRIWSVCEGGYYNIENYLQSSVFTTVIIDLVTMGYTPQNSSTTQLVGVGPAHGADISWSGADEHFKVQYTDLGLPYQRKFLLQVKAQDSKIVITDSVGNAGQNIVYSRELNPYGDGVSLIIGFASIPGGSSVSLCTLKVALYPNNIAKWYKKDEGDPNCIVERVIWQSSPRSDGNQEDGLAEESLNPFASEHISAKPNPFLSTVTINLPETDGTSPLAMHLYDIMGMRQMSCQVPAGQTECMLNTTQLKPGVYFLRVESNGKMETLKIVKAQ